MSGLSGMPQAGGINGQHRTSFRPQVATGGAGLWTKLVTCTGKSVYNL